MRFEGEYFYLCLFSSLFVLCVCDCLSCFLTQSLLLNSLITLGTMLSLSVGVRLGSFWPKCFKFFDFCQVPVANPPGHPASVRTPRSLGGKPE